MEEKLKELQSGYPPEFNTWLQTSAGRVRSLPETMKKCMLALVRTAAGLGQPPNKYDNQRSEAFNNVLKEATEKKAVDQAEIHDMVNNRVVQDQLEEMKKAVYSMGEYRLANEYRHYAIDPIKWTQMTEHQRRAHLKRILNTDLVQDELSKDLNMKPLSVQTTDLDLQTSAHQLQDIWKRAEIIQANYAVIELENNSICVAEVDKCFTVYCTPSRHECSNCQIYRRNGGLCQHVLVAAERRGELKQLLEKLQKDRRRGSKTMMKNLPGNVGAKPGKIRKGKNNVEKEPVVDLVDKNHMDIRYQKPPVYTEYYHNDQPFTIAFVKDYERALNCESCTNAFPRRMPLAPYDICFVHKERYKYPAKDSSDKTHMKLMHKKLAKRFYCVRKECILSRHDYFWIGLIELDEGVRSRLKESHKKLLKDTLGYELPQ